MMTRYIYSGGHKRNDPHSSQVSTTSAKRKRGQRGKYRSLALKKETQGGFIDAEDWTKVFAKYGNSMRLQVKCAQQLGGLECGFYIMRYMLEVLKSCSGEKDLDKVYDSRREEPFTNEEMNEVRDKWAAYFTNNYME